MPFLPRDAMFSVDYAMISADYAVTRCLSVCLSVRHTLVLCENG